MKSTWKRAVAIVSVLTLLSGCSYGYLNHSDRVTLAAGNAVRSNIEMQTRDPANPNSYDVSGLGRNGGVIPSDDAGSDNPCNQATDRAADGSLCGGRAEDERPGGEGAI